MDGEGTGRRKCREAANILANQSYGKGEGADLVSSYELKPFLRNRTASQDVPCQDPKIHVVIYSKL